MQKISLLPNFQLRKISGIRTPRSHRAKLTLFVRAGALAPNIEAIRLGLIIARLFSLPDLPFFYRFLGVSTVFLWLAVVLASNGASRLLSHPIFLLFRAYRY